MAGAHRAGTGGCACLIHYASKLFTFEFLYIYNFFFAYLFSFSLEMDYLTAIVVAKACRSVIDPISNFPELLKRLSDAEYKIRTDASLKVGKGKKPKRRYSIQS